MRDSPHVTNLISETDKVKYKHAVSWRVNAKREGANCLQRRLLSPAFAISYLNGLEPLFQECVNALIEILKGKCGEAEEFITVDIDRILGNLGAVSAS
jgi:hypothetical protein